MVVDDHPNRVGDSCSRGEPTRIGDRYARRLGAPTWKAVTTIGWFSNALATGRKAA